MDQVNERVFRIGTAGWSLPRATWTAFPPEGSHLERYSSVFNAVEINSSFYRPHRRATYARWAASVGMDFRFSVKLPREVTHLARLQDCAAPLTRFFQEVEGLGQRLGCILVQLPPGLSFDARTAMGFFTTFRGLFNGTAIFEPRHITWFDPAVDDLLIQFGFGRAGSDPAICDAGAMPLSTSGRAYRRLHGSPRMYYSNYDDTYLGTLVEALKNEKTRESWCIFDNTAHGFATANAVRFLQLLCPHN